MGHNSKIYKFKIKDRHLSVMIDSAYIPENTYKKEAFDPAINGNHYHSLHEVFIVGEEALLLHYNEQETEYKNCILIVPAFITHYAVRTKDYRLMLSCKGNDEKLYFNSGKPYSLPITENIVSYAHAIKTHFFEPGAFSDESVESLIKLIFCELFSMNDSGRIKKESRNESYLAKIENILFDYQKDINLSMVADELGLSTKQVSRIILKNYNSTLSDMVCKQRLEVASALLKNTDMTISQIVEHINFSSESYFYSTFRKVYGSTPLHYRKCNKRKNANKKHSLI